MGVNASSSCNDLPRKLKDRLRSFDAKVSISIRVGDHEFVGEVVADAAIDSQLDQILNADRGAVFSVVDERGEIIGALTRQVVVDLLASPTRQS